jgi:hypothetical protein
MRNLKILIGFYYFKIANKKPLTHCLSQGRTVDVILTALYQSAFSGDTWAVGRMILSICSAWSPTKTSNSSAVASGS